ncbi:MAG: 16S rRNA (guanine(966)-N(2))-methyltransferase RsmD [Gammaproteobacteria bacterium]|jgi:16S rRNA (guanine966-N2)-methyltransferase|nr:16S rRNA (guanine(966)-N(2))-methyltransferase RsmD [Gammaproteobacteria bacterium]MBT4494720.1 16S rRNA (guanine(966)-N(2))-methyltransferase RsmD [Gammaproteobacteria bacterium]MBT7370905.1 16S rRNA (guanine(966)-N(2))-methyltransferase RsmD [Gammaproteobacteria bacterium]
MKHQNRALRIIGGKWRGRKVSFPERSDIRPTGDRIRETLFNWLMHDIRDARCLDLYAGSGILSIEALSRDAAHVTLVETDGQTVDHLKLSLEGLEAENYDLYRADADEWLSNSSDSFDVIFLDPPFQSDVLIRVCETIARNNIARHFVYLESKTADVFDSLPENWQVHRQKHSGSVHYGLCKIG